MEQVLAVIFAVTAVQHKEVTALAQTTAEDLLAHDVPRASNVDPNEDNGDHLPARVFYRLILGDIAFAEQQGEAAINLTFGDYRPGRTGMIQYRPDGPIAVLFTQRGCHADEVIAVADKQRRDSTGAIQEIIGRGVVLMEFRIAAFQQRNVLTVDGAGLADVRAQRLRQKGGEQTGIALHLFGEAGIEHLHHVHHAGGLIMQVFYSQGFEFLTGVIAQEKSEKQKECSDTQAGKQR